MTRPRSAFLLCLLASALGAAPMAAASVPAMAAERPTAAPPAAATPAASPPAGGDAAAARPEPTTDLGASTCVKKLPGGSVRLTGPAGIQIDGRVSGQGSAITVTGGHGNVGGLALKSTDFSGELKLQGSRLVGKVTVSLPDHAQLAKSWAQDVALTLTPQSCEWSGDVHLRAQGNGADVDMTGALRKDGTYALRGRGRVSFAHTSVPLTGWLRSPGFASYSTATGTASISSSTTWLLKGSGRDGSMPGAVLHRPTIAMTQADRGVTGSASVSLSSPGLTAPATLRVGGPRSWIATVHGSDRDQWTVPGTSTVAVATEDLRGQLGMRGGSAVWRLTAPAQARVEALDVTGTFGITGPSRYSLRARSATGTLLGSDTPRSFTGGRSALTWDHGALAGALSVRAAGEILFNMPDGWTSASTYSFRPQSAHGWTFDHALSHELTLGAGTIRLSGPIAANGAVDLTVSGGLAVGGSIVPMHGFFRRADANAVPTWQIQGSPGDAKGGRIPLSGGAGLVGGVIRFEVKPTGLAVRPAATPDPADFPAVTVTSNGISVQLADDDTFLLPVTYTYTDPNNWSITAAGTTPSNIYAPFSGLAIPETAFHGTVTDTNGEETWSVSIDTVTWVDMANGIDYMGGFSMSNTCPLTANCPDAEGIFIGGDSNLTFEDASIGTVSANGAFLTDKTWAHWDATASSVTAEGITISDADLTIWRGDRTDDNPQITMPDLSSLNGNDMGVEFCGAFQVPVPDVATINTYGCAEWSHAGSVLGQINTGGSVDPGSYNGISTNGVTLTGYAYSGVDSEDPIDILLNGQSIELTKGKNYITADIALPGNVMHDFGTGSSAAATITATGWFDDGNFDINAEIPVNLKGSGFSLDAITVHVGKDGHTFNLDFDANCDVVINGHHFPLDVYIGYQHAGDSTITVGLDAHGVQATQSEGLMDFTSLLPSGDFEPPNASVVDGSFDGKLKPNVAQDPGFEKSTNPGNLVQNGGFEEGMGANIVQNGDFEDGSSGNILANGDFEDTNLLVNGDFEDDSGATVPVGWSPSSAFFTTWLTAGTATGPQEAGTVLAVVKNNATAPTTNQGLSQKIRVPLAHDAVSVSAWVMSNTGSSTPFNIYLSGDGCSTATAFTGATVTATSGSWHQATVAGTLGAGCTSVTVTLVPQNPGGTVAVDAVQFAITSLAGSSTVPTAWRPGIVATFDSLSTTPLMSGYTSGVSIATDYPGTLRSNGQQAWMLYSNTTGYTPGDFDISYKVMFPGGNNSREISDFGFWLDGNYATMNGYCFRLQVESGSYQDGGFYSCSKNSRTAVAGMTKVPDVAWNTWYQVRLTAVGSNVTAYVTNLSTNAKTFTQTLAMPTQPGGYFGQEFGTVANTQGIRYDDFAIYSVQNSSGSQTAAATPSQVLLGDGLAHSGLGHGTLTTSAWGSQPFQYSTGETPAASTTYTYSTWMRAASGTVSGTIGVSAPGGSSATESVSRSFSVGTTWTQVATTLNVSASGHTDVRPSILITNSNAQLLIDDQVLQQNHWWPVTNGGATVQVTSDQAHGGAKSLKLTAITNGANVMYPYSTLPVTGSVYTLTAWVMSPSGVSGSLDIGDHGGVTQKPFTANGTWQQISVTRTITGSQQPPDGMFEIYAGYQNVPLYVDDVVMTVSGVMSSATTYLGAPPAPAGWTIWCQVPGPAAPISSDNAATAHTGLGSLVMTPSTGASYVSYTANVQPAAGSSWTASVWVHTTAHTSGGVFVELTTGTDTADKSFDTNGTGWQNFTVTLNVAHSGAPNLKLQIAAMDTSGKISTYIDDVSVTEQGLQPADDWIPYVSSGFMSAMGVVNASAAQGGSGYLETANHNTSTGGTVYLDDSGYHAVPGMTHEMSFWVRSPNGSAQTGSGYLHTLDSHGNTLDSAQINYTANGTWQQVYLSVPITNTNAVMLRSEIRIPAGATIDIDNVESRDLPTWDAVSPAGGQAVIAILDNATDAVSGANYLRAISSSAGGGVNATLTEDVDGNAINVVAGDSYTLEAYVRKVSGSPQQGTLSLGTSAGDRQQIAFTATSDWQKVTLPFTATRSATSLIPQVTLTSTGGFLDIDSLSLTPIDFVQSDPWSATGGGVTWKTVDDPTRAHDGSYGLMEFSTSSANAGVQQAVTATVAQGDVENVNAWVRSSTGQPISGTVKLTTTGGTQESWQQSFSLDDTAWHIVTFTALVRQPSHTGFTVAVTQSTTGVTLDLDDVTVQNNPWQATSDAGGTATQAIVYDGNSAQSGSSFLQLSNTGSQGGDTYLDMPASQYMGNVTTGGVYAAGTTWQGTAYVRSDDPSRVVSGAVRLGSDSSTRSSASFTVGAEWTAIPVSFTVGSSDVPTLRMDVRVTTSGAKLDIDSVSISDGTPAPDGITTPLPHPQSGYNYLWDDAFGIPGSHLWALSAQIMFEDDLPGLGVGATMYHDPTKTPQIMEGTDWLKGDMVVNISESDPCFLFDFATTGNSSLSVSGVLQTQNFSISFAPRGCQIGLYALPKGASTSFDAMLGSGLLHFDLAITEGDDGPEFTEDLGVTNLNLGGFDFQQMELSINLTPTADDITFVGDVVLPMGTFHGDYDLTAAEGDGINVIGDVDLEDWTVAGGGFDVQEFDFHMAMEVGEDNCGSFDDTTAGQMSMAKKTSLDFTGELKMSCGQLQVLHMQYDYHHGSITQEFDLDYDSDTDELSGNALFQFERSTSWRFFGHRYVRHPMFAISLDYSMNMADPADTLDATLEGRVSVAGGDGSISCTINGGSGSAWVDDSCHLHVHISIGGGHTFDADW